MDALTVTDRAVSIVRADITDRDVSALIAQHEALMRSQSPLEACHVMSAQALAESDLTMLVLRDDGPAAAIGAMRHEGTLGELKSMHTRHDMRGRGYGRAMLEALLELARDTGKSRVSLETGSGPEHLAARGLYASAGFELCPPFGAYQGHPLSVFMTRAI